MAIDPIKKLTIICPGSTSRRLVRAIHDLGVVEVINACDRLEGAETVLRRPDVSTDEVDEKLHKIELILNLLNVFAPEQQGFFEGLTPLPLVVEHDEINRTVQEFDLNRVFTAASELDETYRRADRAINEIQNQLRDLAPLEDLPFDISDISGLKRVQLLLGYVRRRDLDLLDPQGEPWRGAAWEVVKPGCLLRKDVSEEEIRHAEEALARAETVKVVFAFLPEAREAVTKALGALEFEEISLPDVPGRVRDQIRQLKGDLAEWQGRLAQVAAKVKEMAELRRSLTILKAFWLGTRNRRAALARGLRGNWTHVMCGYVRTQDLPALEQMLQRQFASSVLVVDDPAPGENVPVSLSMPKRSRPIQLLVQLFGLPSYQSFDPSPFLIVNFYVFFGICFSDVGYGALLIILSLYLAKKTRKYRNLYDFSRMFLYCGISTVIFGAALGSWFGDLYKAEYLGEGNLLLALQSRVALLDPMDKTVVALVLALGIGMLNQFYGIILKMYGALRHREWAAAFCDGFLWLLTLPGMVILISKLLVDTPPALFRVGLWLFGLGAVGLVLTQGRNVKNPISRLLVGVVSLYGIVGSYGCTAFIGDVLSYCRLLALGLTTSIVALSFNMMAGMVRAIPHVGFILFLIILVFGHVFNFLISVLGAFVHAMRLIFVEFFGRFYEGGARPFQPLGFDSPLCIVKKPGEAR